MPAHLQQAKMDCLSSYTLVLFCIYHINKARPVPLVLLDTNFQFSSLNLCGFDPGLKAGSRYAIISNQVHNLFIAIYLSVYDKNISTELWSYFIIRGFHLIMYSPILFSLNTTTVLANYGRVPLLNLSFFITSDALKFVPKTVVKHYWVWYDF